ncbi:MAG TPA: helix-hairpin-helix domain-containing protein [Edaphobacter sp.]|jgi:competence protein ComEA
MDKKNGSAGYFTRSAWATILAFGGGIAIVSTAALASTGFQQGSQSQSTTTASQYPQLPEGAGKQTLIRVCGKCHSPTNVIANGQNRQGWEDTITKMAGLGAAGSDEEYTEILEYLVKNFPQVTTKTNMNKATAADLESQLGFTTKQSADIVAYRQKNGNFKSVDDLKKVPDLNVMEINARRNRMTFE